MAMPLRLPLLVAAVAVLAGCCSTPFTADDVPGDAPAEGGIGPRRLDVSVLGPDEPAPGRVPLFVFWPDVGDASRLMLLGLRSEGGHAIAHVPDGVPLGVVAGGEGWTMEWQPDAVLSGQGPTQFTVRVYMTEVHGTLTGTWSPAAVSVHERAGNAPLAWDLQDVRPGRSNVTQEGYADRFAGLWANLTWENTLTAQADLGIAAWSDRGNGPRCSLSSEADELGQQGRFSETYNSSAIGVEGPQGAPCGIEAGGLVLDMQGPHSLLVGPGTDKPAAMPLGLAYRIDYTLHFGYPDSIEDLCGRLDRYSTLVFLDPETGKPDRTVDIGDDRGAPVPLAVPLLAVGLAFAAVAIRRRR
jgi:hypothetical protein